MWKIVSLAVVLLFAFLLSIFIYLVSTNYKLLTSEATVQRKIEDIEVKELPTYSVKGMDISKHNGDIDWKVLKEKSDITFIFTKATEGNSFLDIKLKDNLNEGRKAGFVMGAYHFFSLCVDGESQANFFIKNVAKNKIDLPAVVDLELFRNCKAKDNVGQEIKIYLDKIEKYYGQKPIIYTTIDFYHDYKDKVDFLNYPLWVRIVDRHIDDEEKENVFGLDDETEIREIFRNNWSFWQVSDVGEVKGIKGKVDLNVYRYLKETLH